MKEERGCIDVLTSVVRLPGFTWKTAYTSEGGRDFYQYCQKNINATVVFRPVVVRQRNFSHTLINSIVSNLSILGTYNSGVSPEKLFAHTDQQYCQ